MNRSHDRSPNDWKWTCWVSWVRHTLVAAAWITVGLAYNFAQAQPADPGWGQREPDSSAVKRAFSTQRMPWYDEQAEELRIPNLKTGKPSGARQRDQIRASNPRKPPAKTTPAAPVVNGFASGFGLSGLVWTAVIATMVLCIGLFLWLAYMRGDEAGGSTRRNRALSGTTPSNRVEQLPMDIDVSALNFREQARIAFEKGDLRRAFALLYGHVLLTLDQGHIIKLRRGKTNRQYLNDLASEPSVNEPFENIMLAFEQAFFGNRQLPRAVVESCWRDSEAIEQFVAQKGVP